MLKKRALLACLLGGIFCGATHAQQVKPLELNRASRAELESLPGLGPSMVERLLSERDKAAFADWADVRRRVRGIATVTAKKLSALGLRVNGLAYPG